MWSGERSRGVVVRLGDIFWVREVGGAKSAVTVVVPPSLGSALSTPTTLKFIEPRNTQLTFFVATIDH